MESIEQRIARQRTARLAQEAEAVRRRHYETGPAAFFDNIDTSGGRHTCHPWTGERSYNHHGETTCARYEYGVFKYEGCKTKIAQRVMCFAVYGREPPRNMDVTPLCGDHLCLNIGHLCVTPHGGTEKLGRAVTVEEFFNCVAA